MKINYTNPQTGKPSTVVLADHWVKNYLAVMSDEWQDYDLPIQKRTAIRHMIDWCADYYFDPCNRSRGIGECPAPQTCTFTTFIECYMASHIFRRAALPYFRQHSNQGELSLD